MLLLSEVPIKKAKRDYLLFTTPPPLFSKVRRSDYMRKRGDCIRKLVRRESLWMCAVLTKGQDVSLHAITATFILATENRQMELTGTGILVEFKK